MDVLGFGEASIDYVHIVAELPRDETSKLRISESFVSPGGQVATTIAACAMWGLRAGYLGPVGADDNGRRLLAELRARGVDTSRALVREARTRFAVILVHERTGNRTVLWNRDELLDIDPEALTPLPDGVRLVHVDGTDMAASIELSRRAAGAGAITTCDVDTVTDATRELVSSVTIPILAEHLPVALTGLDDTEQALRALHQPHHEFVCVTRGDRGAAALAHDDFIDVPAIEVAAVDTTGAGDVFRAGVIYGRIQGWPVRRLLAFANAAAGLACTRRGAIASVPALEEILGALSDGPNGW